MTKKVFIAIGDEFLKRIYIDFFREEGFLILTEEEDRMFDIILKEIPNIILLDVIFAEKNNFKTLKELKNNPATYKIPIVLFSHSDEEKYRKKAVEFEVKDFLVGGYSSPLLIFSKIMIHLEGEKSYQIPLNINEGETRDLILDLGHNDLICDKCLENMQLNLIRDTSKGKNYFKISLICPTCGI